MTTTVNSTLLDQVRRIAKTAGHAIMKIYSSEFAVELKDDRSPLTAADKAAHELIVRELEALPGGLPVLSEESRQIGFDVRRHWSSYWLVDPLDGTKEFIKRNGEFTVNIALIRDHAAILGVVYAPALELEFAGFVDGGALRRKGDGTDESIAVREPAARPLRIVGSRSHASPSLQAYAEALGPHELKPMGSSLKICLVAEGEADIYPRLGPTSEWDTAAAQAILLSAGGGMIDTEGKPLVYNAKDDLLNPHFLAFGDATQDWLAPLRHS
jgi:3'(2'), 5'-bisphosphate nucleotidase